MSEVLLEFAKPMLDRMPSTISAQVQESALMVATLIWNLALDHHETEQGGREQTAPLHAHLRDTLLKVLEVDVVDELMPVAVFMVERRKLLFPREKRLIAAVEVIDTPQGSRHVNVASSSLNGQ